MRKFCIIPVLCACITGNVFADYNFSFYGRGVFTPLAISGEDSSVSAATTTWDNNARPRIGFTLLASNAADTIGMNAHLLWDGSDSVVGDNAYVWTEPFNWVRLIIGKFEIDDFRGRIGATEFASWILPEGAKDEDAVFYRFKASAGAFLALKPLAWLDSKWNGLTLAAAVGSNLSGERAFQNIAGWSAADVYKSIQAGLSYRFPDIGFARLQFIGNNRGVFIEDYLYKDNDVVLRLADGLSANRDADVIEAAFLYDRINGLKAEAGIKIPLEYFTDLPTYQYYPGIFPTSPLTTGSIAGNDKLTIQLPCSAVVGASYDWNNKLNVLARVDISFGGLYIREGEHTITTGLDMRALLGVYYRVLDSVRIGLDFGYNHHELDSIKEGYAKTEYIGSRTVDVATSERTDIGFAPWVALDLGGGVIKIGAAVMIPSSERWNYNPAYGGDGWRQTYTGEPIISFPISVTYSF
ncbi:MAG: hypothetical protein LBT16_10725 [Treponema sp.]|jgi:hypothetical protein|nr:hypothetical protein [Treponema sp.]